MGFWLQCRKNPPYCNFGFAWWGYGTDTEIRHRFRFPIPNFGWTLAKGSVPNYQVPNGYFSISLQLIYDCSLFVYRYFCVSFSCERKCKRIERKSKTQNPNLWLKTRWKRVSQARIFNMIVEKYLAWVWQGTSCKPNLLQTYVIFNKAARILGWLKSFILMPVPISILNCITLGELKLLNSNFTLISLINVEVGINVEGGIFCKKL